MIDVPQLCSGVCFSFVDPWEVSLYSRVMMGRQYKQHVSLIALGSYTEPQETEIWHFPGLQLFTGSDASDGTDEVYV